MVAPNGARPMKKDHPEVPITISEIVKTGKACFDSGAEAIHFHMRNKQGQHILDTGLCKEALQELNNVVPEMHLQITTEAVGRYSPEEMRKLAYNVMPPGISIGLKEMIPSRHPTLEDIKLYKKLSEEGTKIQHICYEPEDIDLLSNLLDKANLTKDGTWCMFVIGHYSGKVSNPVNIYNYSRQAKRRRLTLDSLASSNADIEVALKNHKKEVILNINNSPTEEETPPNDSLKVKGKREIDFFSFLL